MAEPGGSPSDTGAAVTLRLSTLCSRSVIDAEGRACGSVLDVRLVRDGPANVSGDAALRIDGLVVGEDGWVERIGLFRHEVHGPWLLKTIARWLGPDRSYLPWDQLDDPRELITGGPIRFHGELGQPPGPTTGVR